MPIDFPSSPTTGQVYTYAGVTYVYSAQGVWTTAGASAVANVSQVGFRAHKNSVNQTGLLNNTWTKITYPTEEYDFGSYYDPATSRWTPPAGIVHFSARYGINTGVTASTQIFISIYKNGAELKRAGRISGTVTPDIGGAEIDVDDIASGTDYYEVWALALTGATWTAEGLYGLSTFSGHVIGGPPGPMGPSGSVAGAPSAPQGRLTLQTATPVMTTTQSAKTTIYYTPYVGDRIPIYDGTSMVMTAFIELGVATTDITKNPAAIGASKVNDWFVWNDSGTLQIGHGPDWTSDTARSAGTALTMVNGIWLNNAAITNGPAAQRGTYVGTTRSNAAGTLDYIFASSAVGGGAGFIGVWNAYNRVDIRMQMNDSTASWTYGTVAWRAANNSATARVSFISGLQEDAWRASYEGGANNPAAGFCYRGVGYDTTTALSGYSGTAGATTQQQLLTGTYMNSSLGFHFVSAIEYVSAATGTFYGNISNLVYSWFDFEWRC